MYGTYCRLPGTIRHHSLPHTQHSTPNTKHSTSQVSSLLLSHEAAAAGSEQQMPDLSRPVRAVAGAVHNLLEVLELSRILSLLFSSLAFQVLLCLYKH